MRPPSANKQHSVDQCHPPTSPILCGDRYNSDENRRHTRILVRRASQFPNAAKAAHKQTNKQPDPRIVYTQTFAYKYIWFVHICNAKRHDGAKSAVLPRCDILIDIIFFLFLWRAVNIIWPANNLYPFDESWKNIMWCCAVISLHGE